MPTEISSLIQSLEETLTGQPWYGRNIETLLDQTDPARAWQKPAATSHSPAELLFHMINWAAFTLDRLQPGPGKEPRFFEEGDWLAPDAPRPDWQEGVNQFRHIHREIIRCLAEREDGFLDQPVEGRNYTYRYLIGGLIQHNIYHAGQIALLNKS
ncbi:MAG TPA: DinB family protein [Chitinophagaceae bacterium]|nr:DinB family protein [Chitinophagaceae bacterium]